MRLSFIALLMTSIMLTACSVTPGDAALQAGQADPAAKLYKSGAEKGDSLAAFKLGMLLQTGAVSTSDFGEAVQWFTRDCDLGGSPGCHNAGLDYQNGVGGAPQDFKMAAHFYLRAAEMGYARSQYNLGSLYPDRYSGDPVEGYTWMLIAMQSAKRCEGDDREVCDWVLKDPPGHVSRLRQMLSAPQIADAEARAAAWKPKSGS